MKPKEMLPENQATTHDPIALHFAQATMSDVVPTLAVVTAAAEWLIAHGNHQWAVQTTPAFHQRMCGYIAEGKVWVAHAPNGAVAGTFRVEWDDDDFWPGARDAVHVYTLATNPAFRGRRIGERMLDWAGVVARAANKTWIRLDCRADNPALLDYYTACGFRYKGEAAWEGLPYALFQRLA